MSMEPRMILFCRDLALRPTLIRAACTMVFLAGTVLCTSAATAQANPVQAAATGDIVLLDFSASWCGPCRSMAPLIGEIASAGWAVRHIDVDSEGDLVRRFGVTGVPCYVLLVKGQEMGRINGATTRDEMENLLAKSREALGVPTAPQAGVVATALQSPIPGIPLPATDAEMPLATESAAPVAAAVAATVREPAPEAAESPDSLRSKPQRESLERLPGSARPPLAARGAAATIDIPAPLSADARAALEQKLLSATARLRVGDSEGASWGTGTVVDCRQGEALILTCGHIFRDSDGKGLIEVDLFGAHGPRGLAGQLISWDLKRDLALVSIFTEEQIEPASVGGQQRLTAAGEPVLTVGCNGGQDPTIHHSRVTAVDKYLGPANVQVAGQPVQGRSGGGLFSIDGTLLGVCNAADPTDNEGLFAALPAIHEQLDEAGLAFVYRSVYPSGAVADTNAAGVPSMPTEMPPVSFDRRDREDALPTASNGPNPVAAPTPAPVPPPAGLATLPALPAPVPPAGLSPLAGLSPPASPGPAIPNRSASPAAAAPLSAGEQALIEHVRQHEGKAEVICIVRPHDAPQNASEVFVLQGASRDFVDHLSRTHAGHAQGNRPAAGKSALAALPASESAR
jgi:thioredoxin-like negative regulator of GroEL